MFVVTYNGRDLGLGAYTSWDAAKDVAREWAAILGGRCGVVQVRGR